MAVALGRGRVGVTQEPADDLKAQSARNEVTGESVSVVVAPIVLDPGLFHRSAPEFLDIL